jgi:hypothetical protein
VIDHLRRPDLRQTALVKDAHLVGEDERFLLVVGDEDRRGGGGAQDLLDLVAHLGPEISVQIGEGLVEEDQRGRRGQRPGDCHALLLAARELVRIAVGEVGQVDQVQHARDALPPLVTARALEPEADVLGRGEVGKEGVVLEDDADAPRLGLHVDSTLSVRDGPPGYRDPPLVRRLEPGD